MPRRTNPWAKTVEPHHAYAVYQSGEFFYFVLKANKYPDNPDPFARWYTMTVSPMTPTGEFGDSYASTVKYGSTIVIDNKENGIIRFRVHGERPIADEGGLTADIHYQQLNDAYMLYQAWRFKHRYVILSVELYDSEEAKKPQQTANLFTFGIPLFG